MDRPNEAQGLLVEQVIVGQCLPDAPVIGGGGICARR